MRAALIADRVRSCFQARNETPNCVVSKLIARMVKEDDEPSVEEAEDTIKNVATVAIEGSITL